MHSLEVHSNESACRKKVRLGLEQVINQFFCRCINYDSLQPTGALIISLDRLVKHWLEEVPLLSDSLVEHCQRENWKISSCCKICHVIL